MKQYEAVIKALEGRGGIATLGELYHATMRIKDCEWKTKTPFASIRRIVQERPEIFKVRPGLWALASHRQQLRLPLILSSDSIVESPIYSHTYYQGLLCELGNLQGYQTFVPHQDKNQIFINRPLFQVRTLDAILPFSYDRFVKRSATIDTIWFNNRSMPSHLFEVEHSTDFQNSLIKFVDLQDFHVKMLIVADNVRRLEFQQKLKATAFESIRQRVEFWTYDYVVEQYEHQQKLKAHQ
jgi:hypothetical protein